MDISAIVPIGGRYDDTGELVTSYFEELAKSSGDGRRASNWIQQDVLRTLNENEVAIADFPMTATSLAELLNAIADGAVDNTRAKDVFAEAGNWIAC